jgi:two-component system LytT family sensor kinase
MIYREITNEKERTIEKERDLKNRMEMQLLSSKVNPHFLFNTLNMIITLLKQPDKAERAILNLSDLLRENLEQTGKQSVDIGTELENVLKYLELQKLRFDDKLHYEISGSGSFTLPPLIIQPLVENCIKHNIQHVNHLDITVTIEQNPANTITIFDSERRVDESMLGKGNGLSITKKRVENANGVFMIKNGGITISF